MASSIKTSWFRIGLFFFAVGAGYEFLIIKAGYYDIMRKSAARKRLEDLEERKEWFKEWEKQGIVIPSTSRLLERNSDLQEPSSSLDAQQSNTPDSSL